MSEITIPKFPPPWDAWGDFCCCEKITTNHRNCCGDNMWFISEYGNIGYLNKNEQEIFDTGISVSESLYGHGSFCCGEYLFIYNISDRFRPVIIFYGSEKIYEAELYVSGGSYYYHCCDDYFLCQTASGMGVLFNRGKKIHELKYGDLFCFGDYLCVWSREGASITVLYKDEIIHDGPIYDFNQNHNYHCGGYFSFRIDSDTGILFYKGEKIHEGAYAHGDCYGEYFFIRNSTGGCVLFYENEKLYEGEYSSFGFNNSHFFIQKTSGAATVATCVLFYENKTLYDGENVQYNGSVVGCGDYYFIHINYPDTGILFYKGEKIHEGEQYNYYNGDPYCCGEYFIMTPRGADPGRPVNAIVFYKNKKIYEGGQIYSPYCCGEYLLFRPESNTGILFYKGEKIHEGEHQYGNDIQDIFCCGNYFLYRTSSNTYVLFNEGLKIDEGEYRYSPVNPFCCDDYYVIQPRNDYVSAAYNTHIAFYKDEKIYEGKQRDYGGYSSSCCGEYFLLRIDYGTGILFHKGEKIHERTGTTSVNTFCCEDYFSILLMSGKSIIFYKGEKIEGEYEYNYNKKPFCCDGYLVVDQSTFGWSFSVFYDGEKIYDSEYAISAYCCGGYLVATLSQQFMVRRVIFHNGEIDEIIENNMNASLGCCDERLHYYLPDKTITTRDATFGKMKFDVNTFDRIA